jgi:hypothetical protein
MAVLLDFCKIREDDREIQYCFGYPQLTRSLAIIKDAAQGRPLDGNPDRDYLAVLVKILRIRRSDARWPERGSYMA